MDFVAPEVYDGELIVEIDEEDTASELEFWENDMILLAEGEN